MKITIVCVGKLKEKYWVQAANEYIKRLTRFSNIEMYEVAEEACDDNPSAAIISKVKEKEGARLLRKIGTGDYCIVMDLKGKQISSEKFAIKFSEITTIGKSNITFLIGGSFGLSEECVRRADFLMSMSDMTFPHQLARIVLLEQIYRAMKINSNEKYHK